MKKLFFFIFFLVFLTALTACGGNQAGKEQADYEQTKKMVVDILQTEDGKKALTELFQDEKVKQELTIQSDVVKSAINEVLVSDKGKEMWQSLFKDPSFVKGYTEAIQEEQTKWMKDLMNDAEYQKQMLELLQNPEVTALILATLKSQQFRAHLEETIQQTLETPLFQARIQEILLKAAEEQAKQSGEDEESSGGSGEQQGGEEQSGGSEGGGGGGG
ncbi:spore germination lipoprotein GerD [Oceanobacillus alkalisoli]|uniref:spore germination lipoprotein GerD n=1 Tax=Oceanobacillus alkalisoli TaxID=2925113 RepID=UPI001F11C0B8|nr:spore germination lipoprotein GerD [Oceanobacillus alkalisoli]MCF3943961.1 spore gernimation protein GerD [Oceanobacillus alkalisoli]